MPEAEVVSICLTAEEAASLKMAVASGDYPDAGEILHEALHGWRLKRELQQPAVTERLQQLWAEGKASGVPVSADLNEVRRLARERLASEVGRTPARAG